MGKQFRSGRLLCAAALFLTAACQQAPETKRQETKAEAARLIAGMNAFAVDLYKDLGREPGDLILSPVSAASAFGLVLAGASGPTAGELKRLLHIPDDIAEPQMALAHIRSGLTRSGPGQQLTVSNALWVQKDFPLQPDYLARSRRYFADGLRSVDFASDPAGSRDTINRWIASQTGGRIRTAVQPEQVNEATRIHLVDTAYLKAEWTLQFLPDLTERAKFFRSDGSIKTLPLMNQTAWFRHIAAEGMQAIVLEYNQIDISMVILLPDRNDGLAALESKLSPSWLNGQLKALRRSPVREVVLSLPKFMLEQRHDLEPALASLGVKSLFTDQADFSLMRSQKDIGLTSAVQQIVFNVDENGTETAAVTDLARDASAEMEPPPIFRADHPFLFLICDNRSGLILFMGRFTAT